MRPGIPQRKGNFQMNMYRTPLDNVRVQSSRPPDATNSTQKGCHDAAMRAVANITVTTCYEHVYGQCEELSKLFQA